MSKDDRYHPIDVRYRGPSTAYRGSARREGTRDKPPAAAKPPVPPTPKAQPSKGPWSQNTQAPAAPWGGGQPAAQRPLPRHQTPKTKSRFGLSGLQWFLLALAIYVLLSSVPMLTLGIFDLSSTQMQSR